MSADRLRPLPTREWSANLEQILEDTAGAPLNVHRLMAHNPALLNAWWSFRNHSVTGGTLGQERAELLILRVAVHMGSWYEWAAHVDRATQLGVSEETILAVLHPVEAGNWSDEDAALLTAIDELTVQHALSPTTRSALQRCYSNAQIMDLMAIHGMYLILAAMISTWHLALDEHIAERISQHTSEDDFLLAATRFAETRAEQAPNNEVYREP